MFVPDTFPEQTVPAKLASCLEEMRIATEANNGVLPPPSDVMIRCRCTKCGHEQDAYAVNAVIEHDELVECYAGSAADFCDDCDGEMEQLHWFYVQDEATS